MGFKGIISLFVILALTDLSIHGVSAGRAALSEEEDIELEKQLKILNKPPVNTIQTGSGDIVDCVDINKQPAFDHPLLRNHKIQMKPNFLIENMIDETEGASSLITKPAKLDVENVNCPQGTVPIRGTRKEDLINAKSLSEPYLGNTHMLNFRFPGKHYEILETRIYDEKRYYGAKANISLHNVSVANDQYSMAQLLISGGPPNEVNVMEIGWAVFPYLYGDYCTRLTSHWSVNGEGSTKSGCYNMLCEGFVQVDKKAYLGAPFKSVSVYDGPQYIMNTMIKQERSTGNWWFIYGDDNINVGYWPKEIMKYLEGGANYVRFGGLALGTKDGPSPPMGNGHFPSRFTKHTAYFALLKYVDESSSLKHFSPYKMNIYEDSPKCYKMDYYLYQGPELGISFAYGGPGGTNCSV